MNRPRARLTFVLPVLLVGCGSDRKPDSAQTVVQQGQLSLDTTTPTPAVDSVPSSTPEDTVIPRLLATGREFGTTEQEIRQFLGLPDRVTAEPFENQHDATKTDTILRLYYRDLTLAWR
jgi:hypothetical protein